MDETLMVGPEILQCMAWGLCGEYTPTLSPASCNAVWAYIAVIKGECIKWCMQSDMPQAPLASWLALTHEELGCRISVSLMHVHSIPDLHQAPHSDCSHSQLFTCVSLVLGMDDIGLSIQLVAACHAMDTAET